ncbi:MAG: tetratricopeptide repeat protein [Phycisphaerae bacterium]|nr:tetratricopeptide repeat protein [Phycisphaerae bacterium]NUQ45238.1 tetratricopeptide repeat protein [Phycisphaerae bacterium]
MSAQDERPTAEVGRGTNERQGNREQRTGNGGARRWARFIARCTALVIVLIPPGASRAGPRNIKNGEPIGRIELNRIDDGKLVDSNNWAGRPSVWIFISPLQTSSQRAMQELQRIVDETPAPGIEAVALTTDPNRLGEVREFCNRNRIRLPVVLDAGRAHYGRLGIIVLPTTLLVDNEGKLHDSIPGHDPAYERHLRAHVQFLTGKIKADELARQLASTQPTRDPGLERAERLVRSAALLAQRGLLPDAIKELEAAIEADAFYAPAYLDLAMLRIVTNDLPAAEKLVDKARGIDEANRRTWLVQGVIRFHQNRLEDAEKSLREALMRNPDPALTNYWLARVLEARGDKEGARVCYRAAAERMLPAVDAELAKRGATGSTQAAPN